MITIKDITGASIEVTDLDAAIEQCEICKNSPDIFLMRPEMRSFPGVHIPVGDVFPMFETSFQS